MKFKVIAIAEEIAQKVRETMKSPQYGHSAFSDTAKGYGPCRVCLGVFEIDREDRILFTYNAFENLSSLPLPRPIYIHKNECQRYVADAFPPDLRALPITLEGYGEESRLVRREKASDKTIEQLIEQIFEDDDVNYIHIRNTEAGCFMARVERA